MNGRLCDAARQAIVGPGEKINHALVPGGAQGIGKDTIAGT